MVELLQIRESKHPVKRYTAIFRLDNGKEKKVRFGDKNYTNYLLGASRDQRKLYRMRHEGDNLTYPMSPGSLSFWITWGPSRDIEKNIKSFKKRYNV